MKAKVTVMPRADVLDPQGRTVAHALHALGFAEVAGVRMGKVIVVDLGDADPEAARTRVAAMCESLLANPVIEDFTVELDGDAARGGE